MRITKEIAQAVATQLCAAKKAKLTALRKEEQAFIRVIYLKQLPDEVKECFEKHPDFFRTNSSVYINGPGLPVGYKNYGIGDSLPTLNGDRITVVDKEATKIQKFEDKIADLQKELNELKDNIEAALYNLRTYNNVEKEFPEAFKLLPPTKVNTGLMVNISDIRSKLDRAVC